MHDIYKPTISVVIAARDAGRYVGAMLESLVDQTRKPDQVVLYDDASEDNTAAIAEKYVSRIPGLIIIRGDDPVGISAARNRANAAVTSDFIAVLDADDLFRPETISRYKRWLKGHPDTDLLYADTRVFHRDIAHGRLRQYPSFRTARSAIRRALGSPLIPFKHSSMVYRKQAIEDLGGYDETLPIKVDVDLFIRFYTNEKNVTKLNQTTSCHRKHSRQISTKRIHGIRAYARLLRSYEPHPIMRGFLMSMRIPAELLKMLIRG